MTDADLEECVRKIEEVGKELARRGYTRDVCVAGPPGHFSSPWELIYTSKAPHLRVRAEGQSFPLCKFSYDRLSAVARLLPQLCRTAAERKAQCVAPKQHILGACSQAWDVISALHDYSKDHT